MSVNRARAQDLHISLWAVLMAGLQYRTGTADKAQHTGADAPPAQLGETELPPGGNAGQRQCPSG
jgi:hypothetical protein